MKTTMKYKCLKIAAQLANTKDIDQLIPIAQKLYDWVINSNEELKQDKMSQIIIEVRTQFNPKQ